MEILRVLVTGCGAPGIAGTLYSLRKNFDNRPVHVSGTDINPRAVGRFLCDAFYQIERPERPEYLEKLAEICEDQAIEVLIPQNTAELALLGKERESFAKRGTKLAVSNENAIELANNKQSLLNLAAGKDVPVPSSQTTDTFSELFEIAKQLGWPSQRIVVKPPVSNGMRGVRIIDEKCDLKSMFYSEKPSSLLTTMEQLRTILGDQFPDLMVSEFLPGDEYTVDVLGGKQMTIVPRKRDSIKSGITFEGSVEKREDIIEDVRILSKALGLEYAFGFQFKLDKHQVPKLLECNPRVQGTMVLSTLAGANIVYGAAKQALGEEVPSFSINWNAQLIRYWGAVGTSQDRVVDII